MRFIYNHEFIKNIDNELKRILNGYNKVVLLDYPSHRNLGDTFIWKGEIDCLKRINKKILYKSDANRTNWEYLDSLGSDTAILLHGGGNMGDTWIFYEEFRRKVIQRYPQRKIVILPQTIKYGNIEILQETCKIFEKANNLTILSRTQKDIEEYLKYFPNNIEFCYDMALAININRMPINIFNFSPRNDYRLIIKRNDKEAQETDLNLDYDDWVFSKKNQLMWDLNGKINRIIVSKKISTKIKNLFQSIQSDIYTYLNLSAAIKMYSNRKIVSTNRLHAHIFASLLGIENFVSDNNYGKIFTIIDEYSGNIYKTKKFNTLQEAINYAEDVYGFDK